MVKVFTDCSQRTISKLENLLEVEDSKGGKTIELDLEAEFSNLALDIIGLGVFNYDFGSVTKESPVIKALTYSFFLFLQSWLSYFYMLSDSVILSICICFPFQAVYGTLFEAEHRSTFYVPYWNIPLARWLVPRQRKFQKDLKIINDCLDALIKNAKETRQVRL